MFQPNPNQQRPMMPQQPQAFHNQTPYHNQYAPYQQPPQHHGAQPQQQQQMNGFMQPMPQQQGRPWLQFPTGGMGMNSHQPSYKPNKPSFFKSAFTNENGSFDMNKTVSTVDQVVKTVHQASPLMKSIGSLFIKK